LAITIRDSAPFSKIIHLGQAIAFLANGQSAYRYQMGQAYLN
jgi:hypothetical protein